VVEQCADFLKDQIASGAVIYGVNTGFGKFANQPIAPDDIEPLQRNLILSHAVGVGAYLSARVVRLVLVLKINALAQGYSGVRYAIVEALIDLYNTQSLPCIPEKGSVGASGDLAPLAHLVAPLLGHGEIDYQGKRMSAQAWLRETGRAPYCLSAKEGLALLNGTQVSTALACVSALETEQLLNTALITGALSVDAAGGSVAPFEAMIHVIRRQPGQMEVARILRALLQGSAIVSAHEHCEKVQDPYSLRCQPQVMGACWQQLQGAIDVLKQEINAVTDNPLIFPHTQHIIFGGNFHAEPVGFAADSMALVVAEIGALSERRIAMLMDPQFTGLPAFLIEQGGLHSGFMIAHVTAAALVSENKALAHPTVIDSLPTSANQEDHVSMATYGARRLSTMVENAFYIVTIEYMAASQGIYLRQPLKTSPILQGYVDALWSQVPPYAVDRFMHDDIVMALKILRTEVL
jgi:histidine ammonia-lyase